MKKLYIIFGFLAIILLVTSCFKDKSNYDYLPNEKITVTGQNIKPEMAQVQVCGCI